MVLAKHSIILLYLKPLMHTMSLYKRSTLQPYTKIQFPRTVSYHGVNHSPLDIGTSLRIYLRLRAELP
ncbi:hypothetical protein GQ457_11G031040 [Hibiscus cannabinus]